LKIIAESGQKIGIVLTDQRMPQRTGVELLTQLRKTNPGIIRILTTAYSDLQSAIDAVNSGAVYKYIVKPWDMNDLRIVLMRAMEFFLLQQERDLLIREKMSVIQRMILADRVRGMAVLATSLSHRLRNSMAALVEYLDQIPDAIQKELEGRLAKNPEYWQDFLTVAQHETQSVLRMVSRVEEAVTEPQYTFTDEIELEELIRESASQLQSAGKGVSALDLVIDIGAELPMFKVDRLLLSRALKTIIEQTAKHSTHGGRIVVNATDCIDVWGTPGVRILISGEGPAWDERKVATMFTAFAPAPEDEDDDLGLELLSAFFVVAHHGGDLNIKTAAPDGPGFELRLPIIPTKSVRPSLEQNLFEKILLRFDVWSQA
jgi:two-component system probable response regulator PhcQ